MLLIVLESEQKVAWLMIAALETMLTTTLVQQTTFEATETSSWDFGFV